MPAPTSTTLNVNLSSLLQTGLSQTGVYAYAVYFDTQGNNPTWTTLVDNGAVTGQVQIELPIPYTGGKVYFIIQSSDNPTDFVALNDPTHGIKTESEINWGSATTKNYRYDSFEVTLENGSGDAGNLTSVEGFGLPMDLSITYHDGTTSTRGYAVDGSTVFANIQDAAAGTLVTYAEGPLAGHTRMGLSPTQAVGLNPPNPAFKTSDWTSYVQSLQVADPNVTIAGFFDGTKDANHIYHNPGYFSYELTWDGTYFWLQPNQNSQIQGWIQITPADLENSIYSTLGNVTIYNGDSTAPTTPYSIYLNGSDLMNTGLNNQWGAVLTQFLTGFTAGFYGTSGQSPNGKVTDDIDLNNTWNWDPIYSFGHNLSSSSAAPLFHDKYSEVFYFNSNSYGSGYSDNLMKQYAVGGPLISVYDPGLNGNVANIDITIYADDETPAGYTTPVIYNYLAYNEDDPTATDYATPTLVSGNNIQLNFANGTVVLAPDAVISFDIYLGNDTWSTVTLSGSLWQQWDISQGTGGTYEINPANPVATLPTGILQINNIPVTENGIAWYRIKVATSDGETEKTFNLYTTTITNSGVTEFVNEAGSLAVDGLASIVTTTDGDAAIPTFKVNFLAGVTSSIAPELLVWNTDSTLVGTLQTPNAIVAGTLGTGTASPTPGSTSFTALAGQNNQVSNTVTATTSGEIAFGWTGLNSAVGTPSWLSGYTNKTSATNIAKINFVTDSGGQKPQSMTAVADLDGQWLTTNAQQLGNGTYSVTMTEYQATDTGFTKPVAPTSTALTLTVDVPEFDIAVGLGGNGLLLGSTSPATAGNWVHLEVQQYSLPVGTTLLVYAVNQSGQLIGRDGSVGATLGDATRATIGSVHSDSGSNLLTGEQSVYLRTGEELRFALLTGDHVVDATPDVTSVANDDGTINIDVAGMKLIAHTDNDLSNAAVLAASQRVDNQPWVYLEHGATLTAEVVGSSANTNTLGFVRIDVDAQTGTWSVGGVQYGNTNAFRAAVRDEMDDGFLIHRGGNFTETATWTVNGASGFYAPVLLSQLGDTFVIGEANRDGRSHVRMFGENTFGLEDLASDQRSDFDYNDMVIRLDVDLLV